MPLVEEHVHTWVPEHVYSEAYVCEDCDMRHTCARRAVGLGPLTAAQWSEWTGTYDKEGNEVYRATG